MTDMSKAIIAKSDQLNSDDLGAGPITIKIRDIAIKSGEQPVSIFYEGDNNKPWKPCKSMARVLVYAWGSDAKKYIGRSLTLYRDPAVKWAGMEVGGIRVSHLSHIERDMIMALTATKGVKKPFTVKPMPAAKNGATKQTPERKPSDAYQPDDPVYEVRNALGEVTEMVTAPVYLVAMDKLFAEAAQGGNEQEFLAVFEHNAESIDALPDEIKDALRKSYKLHKEAFGKKLK